MSKTIKVSYATTAEESLVSQLHHLAPYHGTQLAQAKLVELIKSAEKRLKHHPMAAPICQQAALLGINHYRELHLEDYRILYQYDKAAELVVVALILRQRQSIEEQLINYCLMR